MILKETIYIKTIIQTILQINKHKVKHIITVCIPKLLLKHLYFFYKKKL